MNLSRTHYILFQTKQCRQKISNKEQGNS
jgi:hypothetical protein